MMVHVVTSKNASLYQAEMFEFFQSRYEIFVLEKGWFPENKERQEKDSFDSDDATYLIGIEDGRVVVGSRFMPTSKPNLLNEVFPHMCAERLIEDPRVADWTRGFVVPEHRGARGLLLLTQYCTAIMEWALAEGIKEMGGILEVSWLPFWRRLGWEFRAVGETRLIDGGMCIAGYCKVSEEALANAQRKANLADSILVHAGPQQPFVETHVPELVLA